MADANAHLSGIVGRAAAQGPRAGMEDRHVIAAGGGRLLVAVLDGHGGSAVAARAATALPERVRQHLRRGATPRQALVVAVTELDATCRAPHCGTTLTACIVTDRRAVVAQLGDSRLVLVTRRGTRALTRDHRVTSPVERRRIQATGAAIDGPYVVRGRHGLMVTRALGDHWFRPVGVIGTPEITEVPLPADALALVAATDGLWDVFTPVAAGRVVTVAPSPQAAADTLVARALEAGTRDNVTALVLDVPAWFAARGPDQEVPDRV